MLLAFLSKSLNLDWIAHHLSKQTSSIFAIAVHSKLSFSILMGFRSDIFTLTNFFRFRDYENLYLFFTISQAHPRSSDRAVGKSKMRNEYADSFNLI